MPNDIPTIESDLEESIKEYLEIMKYVFNQSEVDDEIIRQKFKEHIGIIRERAKKEDPANLMHEFGTAFFAALHFKIEADVYMQKATEVIQKLKEAKKITGGRYH